MSEEADREESQFDEFTNAALRNPRQRIIDQLVSALLIKANSTSDPLKKIQAICEAAFLTLDKENLDMDLIEVAYNVSGCFIKAEVQKNMRFNTEFISIPWNFPLIEENWVKYIKPWNTLTLEYYALLTSYGKNKYPLQGPTVFYNRQEAEQNRRYIEATSDQIHEEIKALPDDKGFFIRTEVLTIDSFYALQGEFESWALRQLLTIQITIAGEVNAQTYNDVFKTMFGQEEKEEARPESENPMG